MKKLTISTCAALALNVLAAPLVLASSQAADPLFTEISALDSAVFEAFNHCSAPGQL